MSDDKRLSVSFGAFSCEIIGYDDPVAVLNRTVAALQAAADANPDLGRSEEIGDMQRARLTAALAADAAEVGVNGAHLVLSRGEDGAYVDEEAPRRRPLHIAPPPEPAPGAAVEAEAPCAAAQTEPATAGQPAVSDVQVAEEAEPAPVLADE